MKDFKLTPKDKVILVSFTMFMVEGLVNFSIAKNAILPKDERKMFHKPTNVELIKLAASVAVFSYLTGQAVSYVSKKT